MTKLTKIFQFPFKLIFQKMYPEKYARFIGVNFSDGLQIFGKINWGTEPWIITLGSNVFLTNNITFVTHDGGTESVK